MEPIGLIALLLIGGVIYMAPAIVAILREHPNRAAIFVMCLLLGWTFLGWAGAWVWAFTTTGPRNA